MERKPGTWAILCLLGIALSFVFSISGNTLWGLLAALFALPAGIVGLVTASSPRLGGGLLCVIAIVMGMMAIGLALLVPLSLHF